MDLLSGYSISTTFNVYNFFLFDVGNDLRSNLFMREEIIRIIRKHCI
jgi:hypothetical protein